jgi:RNA polymerase sigma-70 factor, ECF subfamily
VAFKQQTLKTWFKRYSWRLPARFPTGCNGMTAAVSVLGCLRIARNAAVDMITQKATRSLGRDGSEAQFTWRICPHPSELSSALDLEYERMVFQWASERVRESVAEHTWQAFWLTSIEELSVEEAAAQLNTRPGNIYFARSRVMARIKELVQQYQDQR